MFPWTDSREPMRFDRFMESALHDPARGYYARRIRGVGRGGDFTTVPSVAPALAKAVAAWAGGALRETGCRNLIELGPGEGTLAAGVISRFPWHRRVRTTLHLVETSRPLRERQRKRLSGGVRWHDSVGSALSACDGIACIYSNEFPDAFPVRRFRRESDGWSELYLLPGRESWLPVVDLPESTIFERSWDVGQIVDLNSGYREWIESLLPGWHRGRMLTIDYGALVDDLYPKQPGGSLRAYFHHERLTGTAAYERPGHQDLTADINFSDLIRWCGSATETVSLVPQAGFLSAHADPSHPGDRCATDPLGAGSAFLCLDQRRC